MAEDMDATVSSTWIGPIRSKVASQALQLQKYLRKGSHAQSSFKFVPPLVLPLRTPFFGGNNSSTRASSRKIAGRCREVEPNFQNVMLAPDAKDLSPAWDEVRKTSPLVEEVYPTCS